MTRYFAQFYFSFFTFTEVKSKAILGCANQK